MTSDTLGNRRIVRLSSLATILLVSGGAFWYLHDERPLPVPQAEEPAPSAAQAIAPSPLLPKLRDYPAPASFEHFTYQGEATRAVSGACKDHYYAILIFPAETDYRAEPRNAFHNRATRCVDGTFSEAVALPVPPYVPGHEYYVIRADQSEHGQWYDAY